MANDDIINRLDQGMTDLRAAYAGLSEDQAARVAFDEWSVKDVLAHLAGWHYEISRMLDRMIRGERPTPEGVNYDDVNAWNAQFVEQRRGRSLVEAAADLETSYIEFRTRVEALPADRLAPGKTAHRLVMTDTLDHYYEHGGQIQSWRQGLGQ